MRNVLHYTALFTCERASSTFFDTRDNSRQLKHYIYIYIYIYIYTYIYIYIYIYVCVCVCVCV